VQPSEPRYHSQLGLEVIDWEIPNNRHAYFKGQLYAFNYFPPYGDIEREEERPVCPGTEGP
jgi:hypothetical protein